MSDKPLSVRAYEACGFPVRKWLDYYWQYEEKPDSWRGPEKVDTDDGAALELLKVFADKNNYEVKLGRNCITKAWVVQFMAAKEGHYFYIDVGGGRDQSLALAICQAIIASGEKK